MPTFLPSGCPASYHEADPVPSKQTPSFTEQHPCQAIALNDEVFARSYVSFRVYKHKSVLVGCLKKLHFF